MQNFKKCFPFVLLTAFCFGTMEVALKLGGSHFNSIQLTFLRFLIGGILLIPFAIHDLKKRQYRLTKGDILYLIILGIVCVASMALFQIGIMKTNAGLAALIISANPIFTMIFAHFLVNDKFTPRKAVVLIICVAGLVVAAGPTRLFTGNNISGIVIVFTASVAFGLFTAMGKRRIAKIGGWTQNCLCFLFGCAALLGYMLTDKIPVFEGISFKTVPLLAYLGIVVTGIGYISFLKAVEVGEPSQASICFFIKPVIAMTVAYLMLNEQITVSMMAGAAIVICGFIINILPVKKNKAKAISSEKINITK